MNVLVGVLLLLVGLAAVLAGTILSWGSRPLVGFSVGGLGLALLVVGSILARKAMTDRFLTAGDP